MQSAAEKMYQQHPADPMKGLPEHPVGAGRSSVQSGPRGRPAQGSDFRLRPEGISQAYEGGWGEQSCLEQVRVLEVGRRPVWLECGVPSGRGQGRRRPWAKGIQMACSLTRQV